MVLTMLPCYLMTETFLVISPSLVMPCEMSARCFTTLHTRGLNGKEMGTVVVVDFRTILLSSDSLNNMVTYGLAVSHPSIVEFTSTTNSGSNNSCENTTFPREPSMVDQTT